MRAPSHLFSSWWICTLRFSRLAKPVAVHTYTLTIVGDRAVCGNNHATSLACQAARWGVPLPLFAPLPLLAPLPPFLELDAGIAPIVHPHNI